jgi:hypothetical protein
LSLLATVNNPLPATICCDKLASSVVADLIPIVAPSHPDCRGTIPS